MSYNTSENFTRQQFLNRFGLALKGMFLFDAHLMARKAFNVRICGWFEAQRKTSPTTCACYVFEKWTAFDISPNIDSLYSPSNSNISVAFDFTTKSNSSSADFDNIDMSAFVISCAMCFFNEIALRHDSRSIESCTISRSMSLWLCESSK